MASAQAQTKVYTMISGWGLYPPVESVTALDDIGKAHVAGIVYGTLGVAPRISAKAKLSADFDPNAYNRALFQLARKKNAGIWLQLRYYDNRVGNASLTAPEILADPRKAKVFVDAAMAAVRVYAEAYPKACTIILGEEETMYHSKLGGGLFWAGQEVWDKSAKLSGGEYLQHSTATDELFVQNFVGINRMLMREIRSAYPGCKVGIHIGHDPLYQMMGETAMYGVILKKLQPLKLDFTFYDLYEKISRADDMFWSKLTERIRLLKALGQTVYYLAQLHTTNSFGAGGGRTPSAAEIDETVRLSKELGVDGFGYYTKNAVPTACTKSAAECGPEDLTPLDPNITSQNMVWESSPRRWKYGLAKLADVAGRQE